MTLRDGGSVLAFSEGRGLGGDIAITAHDSLKLLNGGAIVTETDFADGGSVSIRAKNLVYLKDSEITTSVGARSGDGGNITIDPVFVVLDNSRILANAVSGDGGNIRIVSQFFLASPDSLVQASSQRGISGEISISAPNVDVSSGLSALPSAFFDASLLLRESCAARAGRAASSSFTGVGRGGLPASPGGMAFGSYAAADAAAGAAATGFTLASARMPPCW
jgi:large exoprotein involved in heme utilization and adhesion